MFVWEQQYSRNLDFPRVFVDYVPLTLRWGNCWKFDEGEIVERSSNHGTINTLAGEVGLNIVNMW